MSVVYVREQGAVVRRQGERLLVTKNEHRLMDIPLIHLEQLALFGNVQVTAPAMALLLQREVDVVFFSSRGKFRGRLMHTGSKFAALRHAQLQRMTDQDVAMSIARQVVVGKLGNQRWLLQLQAKQASSPALQRALAKAAQGVDTMLSRARQTHSLDSLRGYEGKAGAYYFAAFKAMLEPEWGFRGRAYYPPPDPFNAVLSFGYSLLLKDATAAVQLVGLDPYLGFFHALAYGRPSLALDVMEEFRPLLVDVVALQLVNSGRITLSDFVRTGRAERPIELGDQALERLIGAYEKRLTSRVTYPGTGEQMTYRRCLELQARQLARVILGKAKRYRPMVLR